MHRQSTPGLTQGAAEAPAPTGSRERASVRAYGRTGVKRTITRYAFEFYQDQIDTLRGLSLEDKLNGEKGSMSEMVREALDMYITKKYRTEEE